VFYSFILIYLKCIEKKKRIRIRREKKRNKARKGNIYKKIFIVSQCAEKSNHLWIFVGKNEIAVNKNNFEIDHQVLIHRSTKCVNIIKTYFNYSVIAFELI